MLIRFRFMPYAAAADTPLLRFRLLLPHFFFLLPPFRRYFATCHAVTTILFRHCRHDYAITPLAFAITSFHYAAIRFRYAASCRHVGYRDGDHAAAITLSRHFDDAAIDTFSPYADTRSTPRRFELV